WVDATGTRTVDSHVKALRRKLGSDLVRTVHGVGYALEIPDDPEDGGAEGADGAAGPAGAPPPDLSSLVTPNLPTDDSCSLRSGRSPPICGSPNGSLSGRWTASAPSRSRSACSSRRA